MPLPLPAGLFRILEIDAVMPDGLIVRQNSESEAPLEFDLTPLKDSLGKEETTLYLTVPERTGLSSPVTGEWPRYASIEGPEVVDDNSPDNVIRIPRLLPKISLMAGEAPPPRYESLPLARVTYRDEAFFLTPYVPPCFSVARHSLLGERCTGLAVAMREKSSYLAEKWQNQVGTEMLRETTELLRPLAESLPLLEALASTGKTHPYDLYLTLCGLAGRLATLRLNQVIPSFPPYHHNDILKTIDPLLDWIERITTSIERSYAIIPFLKNDRLFYYKLPYNWTDNTLLAGFRAPSTMAANEMAEWVQECVIASESHIETARMRRVTGAARESIQAEELNDLMPGNGLQLYRIQLDPHYIKTGEKLMIFHAADHPDKRPSGIVLYRKGPVSLEDEPERQEG